MDKGLAKDMVLAIIARIVALKLFFADGGAGPIGRCFFSRGCRWARRQTLEGVKVQKLKDGMKLARASLQHFLGRDGAHHRLHGTEVARQVWLTVVSTASSSASKPAKASYKTIVINFPSWTTTCFLDVATCGKRPLTA